MKIGVVVVIFCILLFCGAACTSTPWYPVVEGDCVDRAIAIRRHLRDNGYEAEIVLGIIDEQTLEGHAWIKYKEPSKEQWYRIKNLRGYR